MLVKLQGNTKNGMVRAFVALGDDLQDAPEPDPAKIPSGDGEYVPSGLVASRWYTRPKVADFDLYREGKPEALWYRFTTPPGLKAMTIAAHGQPRIWVDGQELEVLRKDAPGVPAQEYEGAILYEAAAKEPFRTRATAAIRLAPRQGFYGGAALPEPARFDCVMGRAPLGDWADMGLATYSGAVRYGRSVTLTDANLKGRILLDLGDAAAAAEVWINGRKAATLLCRPWRVDVTALLRPDENRIEIVVANTLANHYSVGMPCGNRYIRKGQMRAGLSGPVTLEILP